MAHTDTPTVNSERIHNSDSKWLLVAWSVCVCEREEWKRVLCLNVLFAVEVNTVRVQSCSFPLPPPATNNHWSCRTHCRGTLYVYIQVNCI